jgi:hypothetical protein
MEENQGDRAEKTPVWKMLSPEEREAVNALKREAGHGDLVLLDRLNSTTVSQEEAIKYIGESNKEFLPLAVSSLAKAKVLGIDYQTLLSDAEQQVSENPTVTRDGLVLWLLNKISKGEKYNAIIAQWASELLEARKEGAK